AWCVQISPSPCSSPCVPVDPQPVAGAGAQCERAGPSRCCSEQLPILAPATGGARFQTETHRAAKPDGLVGGDGFEPPKLSHLVYSQAHLSTLASPRCALSRVNRFRKRPEIPEMP